MVKANLWNMALATLMSCIFYLRPSEALQLQVCQLLKPLRGMHRSHRRWTLIMHPMELNRPSKTNQFDDSRLLDLQDHQFLEASLDRAVRWRSPEAALFPFTYAEWAKQYRACGNACQLQPLGPPTLYCLRHAGASLDVALGRRDLMQAQQRGNWLVPSSVRRYQKGGRLTEQLMHLDEHMRRKAHECSERIGDIMNER